MSFGLIELFPHFPDDLEFPGEMLGRNSVLDHRCNSQVIEELELPRLRAANIRDVSRERGTELLA
jgi:hypothetical protein